MGEEMAKASIFCRANLKLNTRGYYGEKMAKASIYCRANLKSDTLGYYGGEDGQSIYLLSC